MNTQQMRVELEKKYNAEFTKKLTDAQVVAIFRRLRLKGQI